MKEAPVIVALDGLLWPEALAIAQALKGKVWGFKVHDLFEQELLVGNNILPILKQFGKVFLDFKFHDIPATVGKRDNVYAKSGADIMTVHASGGVAMIKKAVENRGNANIAAVTVLTSLDETEVNRIFNQSSEKQVRELAHIAVEGGAQAMVCSPKELAMLAKEEKLKGLLKIVPGIRGPNDAMDDQKRTATPDEALANGAGLLVIGRPLTKALDPLKALRAMFPNLA